MSAHNPIPMKKDLITINDQSYRVEINMNTAENWERLAGKKLGQFEIEAAESAKHGGVATRAMLLWLFCAIIEGEELEGHAFELDFLEFKRLLKPSVMTQFAPIFIKQYIGDAVKPQNVADVPEEKKKNPIRSRLLSFVRSPLVKWVGGLVILAIAALYYFGMRSRV